MVSAFIIWFGCWPVVIIDFLLIVSAVACVVTCFFILTGCFGFCGPLILLALIKVAFYHCYGLQQMLSLAVSQTVNVVLCECLLEH